VGEGEKRGGNYRDMKGGEARGLLRKGSYRRG